MCKFPRIRSLLFKLLMVLALAAGSDARAALVNRWSFNRSAQAAPSGTTITDSVGGAVATVRGNGSLFTGGGLMLSGSTTGNQPAGGIAGYVDLPNGLVSSKTNLTVEIWASVLSYKANARLFDFGNTNVSYGGGAEGEIIDGAVAPGNSSASDGIYINFCRDSLGTQRMRGWLDGTSMGQSDTSVSTVAGTQYHYVFTFQDGVGTYGAAGGRMTWYRNAVAITSFDVNFHLNNLQDVNNWLGRSSFTADMMANATYSEVRIYNHALTQVEINNDYSLGPRTVAAAPAPDHLWTFTQQANSTPAAGTVFTDSVGGTALTLRGNGATLTGSAVTLPGATTGNAPASSISAYLDLPNGLLSARTSVSFEAWVTPLSSKAYQRLFDFGRGNLTSGTGAQTGEILDGAAAPGASNGYDNIVLSLNVAGTLGSHRLEGQIGGATAQFVDTTAATTAGTQYHYVLVVEDGAGSYGAAGAQLRWYRNGALQNSLDLNFHLSQMQDVNNWIGRSQYTGDSNSNLSLNELRMYHRAITPSEIVASYAAGPDPSTGPAEVLPPVPVPENRWSFNVAAGNAPSGTTFLDAGAGIAATVRGAGATTTGAALVLPGTTNGQQTAANIAAYLDLPNGFVSARPSATYEIWVTPRSSKNWQRIFDFGRSDITFGAGAQPGELVDGATAPGASTSFDGLMLSLNNAGTLGSHRLESLLNDGTATTVNTDLSSSTSTGTEYHYAMVVEDGAGSSGANGCQVRWYRNGFLQGSMDLAYHVSNLSDVNNWIGRSAWTADSNSNIAINELRVHRRVLSTQELLASAAAGPNVAFAAPVANADSVTIQPNQKALIDVLQNDTGTPIASTLQIATAPGVGGAVVKGGKILYTHSGSAAAPVTFTYRVGNASGSTADGTVTVNFASSLRVTNPALAMPAAPPASAWQVVNALPGLSFTAPLCISSIPGDTKQMYVCERLAKIQRVADVTTAAPAKNVFLDVQKVVAGRTPTETIEEGANGEFGLLGLAFHPNYATNGYFYIAYTVRINGGSYYERISRFRVSSSDPTVADPTSERILLQQLDEGPNHNGGDLHFGPDGYLYYTAGDEENPNDFRLNSQKINKDFFSGIFRFDVDKKPGNLEPNPHAAIPTDNGVARFSVPKDNPFVHTSLGGSWDGTYNGVAVTPLSGVRMEFYCTGLRHTWRFSFDSATGDLWAGDVGQDTYEEVDKIVKGGNYGWVYREGKHDTAFTNPAPPTKPAGFTSIDPIYEYIHLSVSGGDPLYKGDSVCGGYVYRGARYPALAGSYIFCDSVAGHVWQMNTTTGATVRLTGAPGAYGVFSAMGVDPSNQDILFCEYITGQVMRLTAGDVNTGAFPTTLSATGLFADLTDLSPAPGLVPYEPNISFWSDYAIKQRWFTIPDSTSKMTWSKDGNWTFPTGMLWVKHFDVELKRGDPTTKKRIETRVLVKTNTGSYGVSYRWNDAGTDATLVEDAGAEFDLPVTTETGAAHTQHWSIPSRTSCLTCHNPQAGHALSFNTRQLNRDYTSYGYSGNELTMLSNNGFLTNSPGAPTALARHIKPTETNYPLEARARSYFAVNCAYCHQAGGTVAGFWDGRAQLPLDQTKLINGAAENNGGNPLNKYIVPGDPTHSIILNRMAATNGFTRMPPLATSEIDNANVALITDWINSGQPARPLYDGWRVAHFAAGDANGDRNADPDHDGLTNYAEYLLGTDPLKANGGGASAASAGLTGGGAAASPFTLKFTRQAFRRYDILVSPDLVNWQHWDIPENTPDYTTADTPEEIDFTSDSSRYFFRLEVSEP